MYLNYLLIFICAVIYETSFFLFVKDFRIKKFLYMIPVILTTLIMLICKQYSFIFIPVYLNFTILMTLSFVDLKYLEISGRSYIFLILPSIASIFTFGLGVSSVISVILVFILFFLFDKIAGIEGIGGGDVKIMLILSFCFSIYDVFQFIFITFIITILIYIIMAIIQRRVKNIKIPMVCAIALSYIYMNLWIYFKIFG